MDVVGHREDLLAGAKRCIHERGYGRTTARDIVAASGTNLASIGYHYGSKEALLNAALIEATGEWSEEFGPAIAAVDDPDPYRRFELAWDAVIATFRRRAGWSRRTSRPSCRACTRTTSGSPSVPCSTTPVTAGRAVLRARPEADGETAWAVGCFLHVVLTGLMAQWLVDADRVPTGRQLADGLRVVLGG
jgi:AcrR family transcriptional regulator